MYVGERSMYGMKLVSMCQGSKDRMLLQKYTGGNRHEHFQKEVYHRNIPPYVIMILNIMMLYALSPCLLAEMAHITAQNSM